MYLYVYALLVAGIIGLGSGEGDAKCKSVGFQCDKEKKKIEFCKKIDTDPLLVETCEGDQVCTQDKDNIRCIDPGDVEIKFICTGKGEFPDVKNCSRTYICPSEDEEPSEVCTCPSDTSVYPSPGLYCMPGECPRESITCTEGAHGYFTLTNNQKTSYYYYCLSSDTVKVYGNVEVPTEESMEEVASRLRIMKNNGKECVPRINGSSSPTPTGSTTPSISSTSTESTTPGSSSSTPTGSTTPGSSSSSPTGSTTPGSSSSSPTGSTTPGSSSSSPTGSTTPGSSSSTPTGSTTPGSSSPKLTESTTPGLSTATTTHSTTQSPTTLKPTEPTKPTPTTTPPEEKPTCKNKGDLHETECDCDYYKCDSNLKPIRRTCYDGLKYSGKLKKCIFGECDESKCIHRASVIFSE